MRWFVDKNIFNGMDNGFNEWGIGMIEVSKVNSGSSVEGFRIANSRKILDVYLAKISICSPRSFISKKLLNLVWYIFICCRDLCDTKTDL